MLIGNQGLKISANLKEGLFDFIDKSVNRKVLSGVFSSVTWEDEQGFRFISSTCSGYKKTWDEKKQGDKTKVTLKCRGSLNQPDLLLHLEVSENIPYVIMWLEVKNTLQKEISVNTLKPLSVISEKGGRVELGTYENKWSFFGQDVLDADVKPHSLVNELYQRRVFVGTEMATIYNIEAKTAVTLGFITTKDQMARIELRIKEGVHRFESLEAFAEAEGYFLAPGKVIESEKLYLNFCTDAEAGILTYSSLVKEKMKALSWDHIPTGWSTWDYYKAKVTEKDILKNMDWLARNRDEFPVEYIQIDHGFEDAEGDWLNWNKKRFPHGPKWMAEEIKKRGFKPGLWVVPLMVSSKSKLFKNHPDWVIRNDKGDAILHTGYATKEVYSLDGSNPEVQTWLKDLFRRIICDCGYEYIKIDGAIVQSLEHGKLYDRNATMIQAYRKAFEAVREGMGDKLLMGGVYGPSIGLVNAMRIGSDVGARWDWSKLNVHAGDRDRYLGSGNVIRCIMSIINSSYMHRNFWINDPDYLLVRDDRSELTLDEARTWLSVIALTGTMTILGDNMTTLPRERRDLITKIFPIYGEPAKPVGFLKEEIPSILNLRIKKSFDTWNVVGVFNYKEEKKDMEVSFSTLGLDKKKAYHVYEFWGEEYLGRLKERVRLKAMRPHSSKILAIREDIKKPQIISTDFHITQGGTEIESYAFNKKLNKLSVGLKALGKKKGKIVVCLPKNYTLKNIQSDALNHKVKKVNRELMEINLSFNKKAVVNLEVRK